MMGIRYAVLPYCFSLCYTNLAKTPAGLQLTHWTLGAVSFRTGTVPATTSTVKIRHFNGTVIRT